MNIDTLILIILLPFIVGYGFPAYGQLLQSWKNLNLTEKIYYGIFIVVFGLLDVLLNLTWGCAYYGDWPLLHGFTFSQRSCYWLKRDGWRKVRAIKVQAQLNKVVPGHIH